MTGVLYRIDEECREPVMIEFLNQLGAWDQWLFSFEQAILEETEQGIMFESPIDDDVSVITETKKRIPGVNVQFMTLKAGHLTQAEIQHLQEIKQSEKVRVWLAKDGTSYVNVRVNAGYETTFTTGKGGYEFSLNIEFPSNFDFFKAKQY
jgi:hypothetical protein